MRNTPVASITTSMSSSFQGRAAGSLSIEHLDAVLADGHDSVGDFDLLPERTHHRVILEEIGQDIVVGQVVDGNDLDAGLRALGDDAENGPADPSESVDGDSDRFAS